MTARVVIVSGCLVVFGGLMSGAPHVPTAPCVTGTLASYVALGSTGCSIDVLRFNDFSFSVLASAGGVTPISDAAITVTPTFVNETATLLFSSGGFSVTGTESVSYLLAYTADPHPEIFDFLLEMQAFTPVAPGTADINTGLCIGAAFVGTACSATTANLHVFHYGTSFDLSDSISFTPVNTVGVRNIISLAANGASADFDSFSNSSGIIPEPGTITLAALALVAGALLRRVRLAR